MKPLKNKGALIILSLVLFVGVSFSQNKTVKGRVTDEKGKTIPGLSVLVEGTSNGTITDMDGRYSLGITMSSTNRPVLLFTRIGYITQKVSYNGQTVINVALESQSKSKPKNQQEAIEKTSINYMNL